MDFEKILINLKIWKGEKMKKNMIEIKGLRLGRYGKYISMMEASPDDPIYTRGYVVGGMNFNRW